MPRITLTECEIKDFRTRVCEVATTLFAERGFDAVTLRGIAAKMGCSSTTPYRYFRNKEDIFNSVRGAAFSRFADALEESRDDGANPSERLRAMIRAYVEFALREPNSYRLMFEMREGEAEDCPELSFQMVRSFNCCRAEVQRAVETGAGTGDVETLAHVIWAGAHGIVSLHLAEQLTMGRTLDEIVGPMMEAVISIIAKTEDGQK